MTLAKRGGQWFAANALTWPLLAAFLVALYGNWQLGGKLTRVCELMNYDDVVYSRPKTPKQELDKICAERLSDPVGE